LRPNFIAVCLDETEDRAQQPRNLGNVGWNHLLLEEGSPADKNLYLYKLHGSIDWRREPETGKLTYSDSSSTIKIEESSLIFGTAYKLQYVDPFLFLVYQLRRWSLEARLILDECAPHQATASRRPPRSCRADPQQDVILPHTRPSAVAGGAQSR
jgi:hypothetical protein